MGQRSKIYQFSNEEFLEILYASDSYADCCRKLGLSDKGSNGPTMIKKRCKELGVNTEHFTRQAQRIINQPKYSLEEILIKDSFYRNINSLKKRLIDEKKLEYKCAFCGNTGEWNGKSLVLELDHINGHNLDHRIENLRFLCPNCHSQTDTYSGRNKKTPC